jgi:L-fuconolactonase
MKIDTHQHYWRYRAEEFPWVSEAMPLLQRDCMPSDCEAAMGAAGVDAVVAVQARTLPAETDFLLRVADQNPEVLGVVGWADLGAADLEHRLEQWGDHTAFKGLRHILQDESDVGAWVNAPSIHAGLRAVQKRGLVYDVLVFDHQLLSVTEFCARHDQHWLVLDHVGKPALREWKPDNDRASWWRAQISTMAALPHVLCKLSGLVTETQWQHGQGLSLADAQNIWACFDHALEAFGPDRLMYGSDWPVCQLSSPYDTVHRIADTWAESTLSSTEQAAFWGSNAIRCYGLNAQALAD